MAALSPRAAPLTSHFTHIGHDLVGFVRAEIADDDSLAAAERKPRHRVFIRHAARQAQNICQSEIFVCVRIITATAERRAKIGIVDGNNRDCLRVRA